MIKRITAVHYWQIRSTGRVARRVAAAGAPGHSPQFYVDRAYETYAVTLGNSMATRGRNDVDETGLNERWQYESSDKVYAATEESLDVDESQLRRVGLVAGGRWESLSGGGQTLAGISGLSFLGGRVWTTSTSRQGQSPV